MKHADQLEILFKDVTATGNGAWAPSSGFVPIDDGPTREGLRDMFHVYDQEENSNINIDDSEGLNNINVDLDAHANGTPTQDNGKKRKKIPTTKVGAAAKLSKQLDRMYDSMDKFVEKKSEQNCSIPEVMEILESMPEIEKGGQLFMAATTKIFLKNDNRVMFVALKDHAIRMEWLKEMMLMV